MAEKKRKEKKIKDPSENLSREILCLIDDDKMILRNNFFCIVSRNIKTKRQRCLREVERWKIKHEFIDLVDGLAFYRLSPVADGCLQWKDTTFLPIPAISDQIKSNTLVNGIMNACHHSNT